MKLIPSMGETKETELWSSNQRQAFVICTYLIMAGYFSGLALCIANFIEFIIKKSSLQANHPLFVFYVLVACCLASDIAFSVMSVEVQQAYYPYLSYMPPTFKVLIGIDQIWMMSEFMFHLRHSIRVVVNDRSTLNLANKNRQKTMIKLIRIGRCVVTALIVTLTLAMLVYLSTLLDGTAQEFDQQLEGFQVFFTVMFSALFVGLLTTVIILTSILLQKRKVLQEKWEIERYSVRKEVCLLVVVLMVFNSSYAFRILFDVGFFGESSSTFSELMVAQFMGIPFDLIPIFLILILHRKNFAKINQFEHTDSHRSTQSTRQDEENRRVTMPMFPESSSLADTETLRSSQRRTSLSQRDLADDEFQTETISSHDCLVPGGYESFIIDKIQQKYGLLGPEACSSYDASSDL